MSFAVVIGLMLPGSDRSSAQHKKGRRERKKKVGQTDRTITLFAYTDRVCPPFCEPCSAAVLLACLPAAATFISIVCILFCFVRATSVTRDRRVTTRGDGAAGAAAAAVDGHTIKSPAMTLRHHRRRRSREPLPQPSLELRSSSELRASPPPPSRALRLPCCQFAVTKLVCCLVTGRARPVIRPRHAVKDSPAPPVTAIIIIITRPLYPRRKTTPITASLI
jgi:hypothetical protein